MLPANLPAAESSRSLPLGNIDRIARLEELFPNLVRLGYELDNTGAFDHDMPGIADAFFDFEQFEKRVNESFSETDTLLVDGWLLSRAEASFCVSLYRFSI